jgi:NADPH:quinone reductase-like Zn-dependent oxidoreductase
VEAVLKAVVIKKYGKNDVVEIGDMPRPRCAKGMVMIHVRAASVNPLDWKVRAGMLRLITGSKFPKILGSECAGEAEIYSELWTSEIIVKSI